MADRAADDPDDLVARVQALERALATACAVIEELTPGFAAGAKARLDTYRARGLETSDAEDVLVYAEGLLEGRGALPHD